MAKAEHTTIEIEKVVVEEQKAVTLTMTVEEAKFLSALMTVVGGDKYESLRGHAEEIRGVLKDIGYDCYLENNVLSLDADHLLFNSYSRGIRTIR